MTSEKGVQMLGDHYGKIKLRKPLIEGLLLSIDRCLKNVQKMTAVIR